MKKMYLSSPRLQQAQRFGGSSSNSSNDSEKKNQSNSSGSIPQAAGKFAESAGEVAKGAPGKILSTGGLLMAILLSLLFGLAYVVRSLKNVKLTLRLVLKRDDRAEKKY